MSQAGNGGLFTATTRFAMKQQHQQRPAAMATCAGCSRPIRDQFILRVSPDLEWHADCLRCCECRTILDETCTCFVKQGRVYCKADYQRMFGPKCRRCSFGFGSSEYVMKVSGQTFHVKCFTCSLCDRRLMTGEKFYLSPANEPICQADHSGALSSSHASSPTGDLQVDEKDNKSPSSTSGSDGREPSGGQKDQATKSKKSKKNSDKPTRVRTVLTEKQLHTLRTCYAANPRPDALMKEQLCEMTGLSPRVIRVWFQNKRCKDKKRSLIIGGGCGGKLQGSPLSQLGIAKGPVATSYQAAESTLPPLPGIPSVCRSPTILPPPLEINTQYSMPTETEPPHTPHTPASFHGMYGHQPMPSPLAIHSPGYFAMPSPTIAIPPAPPHPYPTPPGTWSMSGMPPQTMAPPLTYPGQPYRGQTGPVTQTFA
eukprot:m.26813 g.26813  ORF g.26813 m.26813 type:complete len:426 (+) comp29531_c0_seq2:143-1420(+)